MTYFKIKISVLPPKARTKDHPLHNESKIIFECKNYSITDAVNCALEHKEYKSFCKRNIITKDDIYVYYTDDVGNWVEYNDMTAI